MARTLDTREYLNMVCELLDQGQTGVPVPVAGSSMTPFLHHGDTVHLDLPKKPLRRGDIVLFTRPSGQYVLHRIVAVHADGSFTLLGDAQTVREHVDGAHRIRAIVTSAVHKGELLTSDSFRWRFFATVWMWMVPFRHGIMSLWGKVKKIIKTR